MFLKKQQVSCFLGCVALAVTLSAHPSWPQAGAEKKADTLAAQDDPNRELLRLAKLPTDGPGLLTLLEKLGGRDEDLLRLDQLIAQLGDLQFAKRADAAKKTVALNQAAIAGLKTAQLSKDAEIASRAKDCLKDIYKGQKLGIPLTAVRVLARLKPTGLAEALLHFLPYTVEEEVQEEVWFTLYDLVKEAPRLLPLMEKALQDPLPARRALAGCVLGRLGSKPQQTAVAKLLTDSDPHVRLRSAQGLLAGKNLSGVPALIQLLEHPAVEISWSAEELLHYLAGDEAPTEKVGAASDKERLASRKAWGEWWSKRGGKFSFAEVEQEFRQPGLFLVILPGNLDFESDGTRILKEESKGQLLLIGCDGRPRWHFKTWLSDAQLLPGNRLLIIGKCSQDAAISERGLDGKILWSPKIAISVPAPDGNLVREQIDDNSIVSVCRLFDGTTFLGLGSDGAMVVNGVGDEEYHIHPVYKNNEGKDTPFYCAGMLANGRVLGLAMRRIPGTFDFEPFDFAEFAYQTGQELKRTSFKKAVDDVPAKLQRFAPGVFSSANRVGDSRFLIDIGHDNGYVQTLEIDAHGRAALAPVNYFGPMHRLRDGSILTLAHRLHWQLVEHSQNGRLLWEADFAGARADANRARINPCLGLVAVGFDGPSPANFDLASVSSRVKQLKSKDGLRRMTAIAELRKLGPKAVPAIPALAELLDDPDPPNRTLHAWFIMEVLEDLGPASFPVIFKAAHHKEATIRAIALTKLARFTDKSKIVLPLWLDGLKDKDIRIRLAALDGIAASAGRRLVQKEQIPDAERKEFIRRVVDAMSDPDLSERACSNLGAMGPDAIPDLIQILKGKNVTLRMHAVDSLRRIGPDAAVAIPELVEAFEAKDVHDKTAATNLRYIIIDAFRIMGPKAKAATPLVANVLRDKSYDPLLRGHAIATLAAVGERTAAIEQILMEVANDDHDNLRLAATEVLKKLRDRKPR